MLTDSTALVIQRRTKRVMTSSGLIMIAGMRSGLGVTPDDVADRDLLWDQAELEEAIGYALLGRDDVVRDRLDRERRAVGGDGLDIKGNAGDSTERSRHLVAVGFRPIRGRCRHIDNLLQDRPVIPREVAVGDI